MSFFAILSRYINRQLLFHFFLVFLAILGIAIMFDSIETLRRVSGREEITLWFIAQYAVTRITKTVEIAFPFILMAAAMITFWRLSKSNEFVVIRCTGVSVFGFLRPLIISTFLLGVFNVAVLNPLAAKMFELHQVLGYQLETHNPHAMLFSSKGLWIREAINDDKILLLQAKSLHQDDDVVWMRDVSVTELDKKSQITKSYEAYFATLNGNILHMKDVKLLVGGKPIETMRSYEYETTIDVQRIKENFIEPEAISFWQLPDTINFYERAGFSARQHWMRFLNLLVSPFLLIGMLLLAAVFMLQNTLRGSSVMLRVICSIAIGFTFYFSSQVVYAFGLNGYIPVWLSVITPTLVLILVSCSLLLQIDEV